MCEINFWIILINCYELFPPEGEKVLLFRWFNGVSVLIILLLKRENVGIKTRKFALNSNKRHRLQTQIQRGIKTSFSLKIPFKTEVNNAQDCMYLKVNQIFEFVTLNSRQTLTSTLILVGNRYKVTELTLKNPAHL